MRVLPILLSLALPAAAQEPLFTHKAASDPKDPTRVEVIALFDTPPPGGYLPVRVTVVNPRKNDARLDFRTTSSFGFGDDDSRVDSEFSVTAKAGETLTRDLLLPVATAAESAGYYGGLAGNVSVRMSGSFGTNSGSLGMEFAESAAAVLMSEPLHTDNASKLDSDLNSRALGSSRSGGSARFAARFDPLQMPEDWRAYSGYDAMLLTDDDWSKLGSGARTAILQWCRLGARLIIYRLNAASDFDSLGIRPDGSGYGNYGHGNVTLESLENTRKLDATRTVDLFHGPSAPPSLNASINKDYASGWELYRAFHEEKFNYGLFVVVLIAFGILVGPVNLFVFAKSGQRHRLFITTPVISLGASALLIALILVKDGVGGKGRRVALVEVRPDSGENNAYVVQEQLSRTGVLLGGSFQVGESAAIAPLPIERSPWSRLYPGSGGAGMRYSLRFDEGVLGVSGDWFQSRSEQAQLVRSVIPTRGRIELRSQGGPPVVLSTFEFPIESLYYVDRSGGCWTATGLQPGSPVTCAPVEKPDWLAAVDREAGLLAARHSGFFRKAAERPDHWFATAGGTGLTVGTIDSIGWRDDRTILTGPIQR